MEESIQLDIESFCVRTTTCGLGTDRLKKMEKKMEEKKAKTNVNHDRLESSSTFLGIRTKTDTISKVGSFSSLSVEVDQSHPIPWQQQQQEEEEDRIELR